MSEEVIKKCTPTAIHLDLLRHLSETINIKDLSKEFSAFTRNFERVNYAYDLLQKNDFLKYIRFVNDKKNNTVANNLREQGNQMFRERKLREAFEFYTKSLANAETNTENVGLAYANRSAVLFGTKLYQQCLIDIDNALKNNYPANLTHKLTKRQINARNSLDLEFKLGPYHELVSEIAEKNSKIECASASVEIKKDEILGRHIVAARNIKAGEILAIENAFAHVLIEELYTHCHECLELCYNLIPCENCTKTLYCGESCKNRALNSYHKFECSILASTELMDLDKSQLLPLKIAILIRNDYEKIISGDEKFLKITPNDMYCSNRYKEIHNLEANTNQRPVSDLFKRATYAAVIFHLIRNHTNFFKCSDSENIEIIFKELLLLHLQTYACNFHEISELALSPLNVYESCELAAGAYSFMSLLNHSCNPNVIRDCFGSTLVLRAIENIEKGEQCLDNYGPHYAILSKSSRQDKLKKQYYFNCNCRACTENWPLYHNLPNPNTGIQFLGGDDWEKLAVADVETAKKIVNDCLSKLNALEKYKPCKMFNEYQEIVKQCFAALGNKRRVF